MSPLSCNIKPCEWFRGGVVRQEVTSHKTKLGKLLTGYWLLKYIDDFVVTSKSKDFLELDLTLKIENFLLERNLPIPKEKSKIVNPKESDFEFLG